MKKGFLYKGEGHLLSKFFTLMLCMGIVAVTAASTAGCTTKLKRDASQTTAETTGANGQAAHATDNTAADKKDVAGDGDTAGKTDEDGKSDVPEIEKPIVTITMDSDEVIQIELYPDMAPNTVNNFISLVQQGFYDGLSFHRIFPGFMIQGGDPLGSGIGGPGYGIKGEFASNGFEQNTQKHKRGIVSMARTNLPDTAGSQFFIMVASASHLDGEYAAFGKVIEGMTVVDDIVNAERTVSKSDAPVTPRHMKTVTVELFGVEYPEPEKIK